MNKNKAFTGMAQGAKNWGCTIASRSKKGKFQKSFCFLLLKNWGARAPCAPPIPPPLDIAPGNKYMKY